ncbi:MAG: alanine--tRNA ligase [Elusimicrobiota bacterium]
MKESEIRDRFKKYFEDRKHKWYSSMPLVPPDDPSMLFTTAGMVQFKKQFLGEAGKLKRAASIQKCLRTSDIDEVGKTSRHLTFFEMYGNFSFGDYFKEEAIKWGWEFLVEEMGLPEQKLHATIYQDDDEAHDIWKKYLPDEKIHRLGEKDNFWKMGDTGPCGPCSEILYDQGPEKGCKEPDCKVGCECDRYLEVWNLVFTQFDRQADGTLNDLPKKNIDTGMGLERLHQVIAGKDNVYETAVLKAILDEVEKDADSFGISSGRIIADHVRSITFLIGDGVSPSNEGRGYVLRRLIRRASREGKKCGWNEPMLWKYTAAVVDLMGEYYPYIVERAGHIAAVCKMEEEAFLKTLDAAMRILKGYISEMKNSKETMLSAENAFKLYDTYGLPVDITRNILDEKGLEVDMSGFAKLMEERAKSSEWKEKETAVSYWDEVMDIEKTVFTGYESLKETAKILKIVDHGKGIVLDSTPMYAESGGQVGDTGVIKGDNGSFIINNTIKEENVFIHTGKLEGELKEGDEVEVTVDYDRRKSIERNHTATHLLQSGLREILGEHIQQNGSLVEPERLRFDFTHTESVSREQLADIELKVNNKVLHNYSVIIREMNIDEAKEKGALAFFGEKYSDVVRTITIKDPAAGKKISMELCGGTHVKNTGEIGLVKVVSETGIAAGVRRLEAVTGIKAVEYVQEIESKNKEIAALLNSPEDKIIEKLNKIKKESKDKDKKINQLENKLIMGFTGSFKPDTMDRKTGKAELNVYKLPPDARVPALRNACDNYTKKEKKVAVAVTKSDGRVTVIVKISKDLTEKYDAREILNKITPLINGSGGGKWDMAQGGGNSEKDLDTIVKEIYEVGINYIS